MNSADIAELGIKPDARVSIKSTTGTLANVRVQAFDVPRNNILAYYPEANILISTERDTRSQTPAFKSVAVCVEVPGE
jgi:formylmethanofuran dehydrogenase subunit D